MFNAKDKGFVEEFIDNEEQFKSSTLMQGLGFAQGPLQVMYRVTEKGRNEIREEYKARHIRLLVLDHNKAIQRSWLALITSLVVALCTLTPKAIELLQRLLSE